MDLINILFAKALNNGDTTKEYVDEAIKALKGEVNADLDTLEELSKALGNDPDFFLTIKNEIDSFKTELVTGKDAATENTRFAIGVAEQSLEVPSMEEFNQLKDEKLSEPTEGLAVGKYFRVAAIDENGHAVLEAVDAKDVGVQDVQVAGASVVEDGVANVPLAKNAPAYTQAKYGLVALGDALNYGLTLAHDNGHNADVLTLSTPSQITIDNRYKTSWLSVKYAPLMATNLDYAVKVAMCDGHGAAWTADEQAAARERMGIYDWIMFADITLDESTTLFNISIDSISFNELLIYTEAQGTGATCKWKIGCSIGATYTQALWNDSATTINDSYYAYLHLIKFGGKYISRACKPRKKDVHSAEEQVHILPYSAEYSDDNKVLSVSFNDWDFAAGSKIYVMYR